MVLDHEYWFIHGIILIINGDVLTTINGNDGDLWFIDMICFLIELIIINGDRGYKNGMGCCTKMGYGWNIVEHSLDINIY